MSIDPVACRKSLDTAYRMLDAANEIWQERRAQGPVTVSEMVAAAHVRQTIESWIATYRRELTAVARRGGRGFSTEVKS